MSKDVEIYELMADIVYFSIEDEEEFDTEETFKPHKVLHTEEIEGMYFNRGELRKSLNYITIN